LGVGSVASACLHAPTPAHPQFELLSLQTHRLDGLQPGELPPSFEAEERSHPDLSDDLLHLVSGRTLLGSVRLRKPLALESGCDSGSPAVGWAERLVLGAGEGGVLAPRPAETPAGACGGASAAAAGSRPRLMREQLQQLLGAAAAAATTDCGGLPDCEEKSSGGGAAAASAAVTDAEWLAALAAAHRLRTPYDWAPSQEQQLPLTDEMALDLIEQQIEHDTVCGVDDESDQEHQQSGSSIGAAQLLQRWEGRVAAAAEAQRQRQQQQAEEHSSSSSSSSIFVHQSTSSSSSDSNNRAAAGAASADGRRGPIPHHPTDSEPPSLLKSAGEGLSIGLSEALRGLAGQRDVLPEAAAAAAALNYSDSSGSTRSSSTSSRAAAGGGERAQDQERHHSARAGDADGSSSSSTGSSSKQQLLSSQQPSADWNAYRWDFDDQSGEGVTVVEAVVGQAGSMKVVGVAVRDERQEGKPIKVRGGVCAVPGGGDARLSLWLSNGDERVQRLNAHAHR